MDSSRTWTGHLRTWAAGLGLLTLLLLPLDRAEAQSGSIQVETFESYAAGDLPDRWRYLTRSDKTLEPIAPQMSSNEYFRVMEEGTNRFAQGYTKGEALRITLPNRDAYGLTWSLEAHPRLSWMWRAHDLPEGASERDENDTGAALYVTFDTDWLGRPKSVKYTYSSTLPVGTTVDFGPLKVLVVASGQDPMGDWLRLERDVQADYRRLFGDDPPDEPLSITLWSDSDNTGRAARVDVDDLMLHPEGGSLPAAAEARTSDAQP